MNSRVPPNQNDSAEGVSDRPQDASLGRWLNSRLGPSPAPQPQFSPPQYAQPQYAPPPQPGYAPQSPANQTARSVEEIHRRLDAINAQINQMSVRQPGPAPTAPNTLANQLNDAIARLDMRLSHMAQTPPHPQNHLTPSGADRAAYRDSPPLAPQGMDAAIAEISARRSDLGGAGTPRHFADPQAQAMRPAPAAPLAPQVDLSGIERQLHQLTNQMNALARPDHLEESIAAFRQELADIRRSLTEALPRRALESLETELRTLAQKIEQNRDNGADQTALSSIETALNDIYRAVRTLTPAEQLAGYDAAIQNLSSKIDVLVRANPNSNIVEQLEDAIAALRGIAANVASNDAINRLNEHIHALGEKVDHLVGAESSGMLAALEQRIALLTTTLENRSEPLAIGNPRLEDAIQALSERIDRLSVPTDGSAAMAQVEQRIAYLLERLEAAQPQQPANFGRIEESLTDVLRQLDQHRAHFAAMDRVQPQDHTPPAFVDTLRQELVDVRHSQSETDRRTQDSLEAVHNTLSHVVDRLSMIESDLRRVQSPPPAPPVPPPTYRPEPPAGIDAPPAPGFRPEMPNPARGQSLAAHSPANERPFSQDAAMERPFERIAEQLNAQQPAARPAERARDESPFTPAAAAARGFQREPIDPNLPPDFPLEPGARSRTDGFGQQAGPSLAFDADERNPATPSNFIAAARRAAQASMETTEPAKPSRMSRLTQKARAAAARATAVTATATASSDPQEPAAASSTSAKIRSVLVGVSVVVIVLGTFKMALALIDSEPAAPETAAKPAPTLTLPTPTPKAEAPVNSHPALLTSPTAVQQHSFVAPATPAVSAAQVASADVTGTVSTAPAAPADKPLTPVADAIPDALAGPALQEAARRGEPAAAYEVASRYAEGKGVASNYAEAAKWYERAAQGGIVPAMFRLGSILEKGLGGKKDVESARHYYMTAAERGHAKAMHNLAVLDADGGGKGPNYKSAAVWFKKAAEHGVADSQYNLAILYARGIGVEQNLAESYKWFSLASAQGDADAGRKRDDVAKRLDPQSLAAAKLAIQTFSAETQPEDVVTVATPAGGWDADASAAKPTKGKTSSKSSKTAPKSASRSGSTI